MGEIQGFVTRTLGRTNQALFGITSGVAEISRNQVVASKANGTIIGEFSSIGEAQRAVERSLGSGFLSWTRQNLRQDIEHWRGESRKFFPGDLNPGTGPVLSPGPGLLEGGLWFRADQGIRRLVPAAPPPSKTQLVATWSSFDGSGNSASAGVGARPTLANGVDILTTTGLAGVLFDAGEFMSTTLAALAPPYSIFVAVSYTDQSRQQNIIQVGAPTNFSFAVDAGGDIEVRSDSKVDVPALGLADGTTFVLSAVQHADSTDIWLNGEPVTGIPGPGVTPVSAAVELSSVSDAWAGAIFEVIVTPSDLNPNIVAKLNHYLVDRYKPKP
jgi:hypothetical protein